VAASAIVAWSGLSVHAQVAVMLRGTDIRLGPYIAARFLHAVLAAIAAWFALGPAGAWLGGGGPGAAPPVLPPVWLVRPLSRVGRVFRATATATQLGLSILVVAGVGSASGRWTAFWSRAR